MVSRGASAVALAVLLVIVMVGTSSVMVDAGCPTSLVALEPCLPAVKTGSNQAPSGQCCGVLKSWGMPCLCSVMTQYSALLPSYVDKSKLRLLPGECKMVGSC
ncbi:unnamed protein product [Calypogeia fissa]